MRVAFRCLVYWGFPGCLRDGFPCLAHGEDALRLNATVPYGVCLRDLDGHNVEAVYHGD
jgi:hypothetical protein